VAGVIYAFSKSSNSKYKIAPQSSGVGGIGKQESQWKRQVQVIDESEGLKPELMEQMKKELLLLRSKVLLDVEKALRAASNKSEEEMEQVFGDADTFLAELDKDTSKLHGDSVEIVRIATLPDLRLISLIEKELWEEAQALALSTNLPRKRLDKMLRGAGVTLAQVHTGSSKEVEVVESITVPATVRNIKNSAFAGFESLKSVTFNDGLEEVGRSAFEGCTSLTAVKLPASLKKIDEDAFAGCSALRSVESSAMSDSDESGIMAISKGAFRGCKALGEWRGLIGWGAKIERGAFDDCPILLARAELQDFQSIGDMISQNECYM
jgi:hypothetical protein